MHRIRAITLDLDDTLWEVGPVIRRAEAELWAWLQDRYPAIPARFSAAAVAQLREQVIEEYRHRNHDLRFLRKMVLARMAIDSGYTDDMVDDAFAVFDAARNRVELFPDVRPALAVLREHFTVIAVTNGNANLERIGIRDLFHGVVTAVDAGVAKPARPIFDEAVKRAGVAAEETLHVGDHPEIDIGGASDAGLRTAWMNRAAAEWPEYLRPPDATVSTVSEVRDLLADAMRRDTEQTQRR